MTARSHADHGFTMVELMVALLIMGILLALAVPTFLGTTAVADDRSAQANLTTVLTDARTLYQSNGQSYDVNGISNPVALAGQLTSAQLSLTFHPAGPLIVGGGSDSLSDVSVGVSSDGNGLVLAAYSLPGNCFYVVDTPVALDASVASNAPYAHVGASPVTTTAQSVPAGSLGLPSVVGTSFVEVKGDRTKTDCNAYRPKSSGPPATVVYSRTAFPN
jgi:prepilin-type N-terminal cleavage/methylation domain-containing protein